MKNLNKYIDESMQLHIRPDILQYAEKFHLPILNRVSKKPGIVVKGETIYSNVFIPKPDSSYSLSDIFDNSFKFDIKKAELCNGWSYSCDDLLNDAHYDSFPKTINYLTLKFIRNSNMLEMNFDKLVNSLPNLHTLEINEITSSNDEYKKVNMKNLPTTKLTNLIIHTNTSYLNLDSIHGVTCDNFIIDKFTNDEFKEFYTPIHNSDPKIVDRLKSLFLNTINKFLKRNSIRQLIIGNIHDDFVYQLIVDTNDFHFEKIKF